MKIDGSWLKLSIENFAAIFPSNFVFKYRSVVGERTGIMKLKKFHSMDVKLC